MGSHALIMMYSPDQSDELGVLDGDSDSVSPQNRSLLTAVLKGLTVQLEYFDHSMQSCKLFSNQLYNFQILLFSDHSLK